MPCSLLRPAPVGCVSSGRLGAACRQQHLQRGHLPHAAAVCAPPMPAAPAAPIISGVSGEGECSSRQQQASSPAGVPWRNSQDFQSLFEPVRLMGKGTFGMVHHARHIPSQRDVAVKVLSKSRCLREGALRDEVEHWATVQAGCSHVARLYEVHEVSVCVAQGEWEAGSIGAYRGPKGAAGRQARGPEGDLSPPLFPSSRRKHGLSCAPVCSMPACSPAGQ